MRLTRLIEALPEYIEVRGSGDCEVSDLCADSRKVKPGDMFFCIPGTRMDAHDFAPEAVAKGAAALVVQRPLNVNVEQIVVNDVRAAMARIAAAFYGYPAKRLKLIGLTGTCGKTTTCFLIKSILEAAGYKVGLIGTITNMIGDRLLPTVLTTPDPMDFQRLLRDMANDGVNYVVMEVSAHALELRKLEGIEYEVAAFMNFSQDHLDFFHTMEAYFDAKMLLFTPEHCKNAVINADDEHLKSAFAKLDIPATYFAIREDADTHARDIEIGERGIRFNLAFHGDGAYEIHLQLSGIFNVYNSLAAAAVARRLNIPTGKIEAGLNDIRSVPGRIEILDTDTPYRVILDYAHKPEALHSVLTTIRETARGRMIALFGCGGDRDEDKRPTMGRIAGELADFCVLTSDNPRNEDPYAILVEIEEGIKPTGKPYIVIENRRSAIREALRMAKEGDVVVLAGKGHETYQEIRGVKTPFDEKTVVKEILIEEMR